MNYISIDFIVLTVQIERLNEYKNFLDSMIGKMEEVLRSIEYMSLGETEIELRRSIRTMREDVRSLGQSIIKLKKILELYNECENVIIQSVNDLPLNMQTFDVPKRKWGSVIKDMYRFGALAGTEAGVFSGHSIINEDWLEKLIYETEG